MTRRLLSLVLLLLLCAAPAHAAIAIVQSGGSGADSASNATSASVDTTGATLLVMSCSWYNGSGNASPSDSKGNTWVQADAWTGGGSSVGLFYVDSVTPTVGSGHTFQCDGADTFPVVTFIAASGTVAAPLDQSNSNQTASSVEALTTGSVTPTVNNELIVAAVATSLDGTSHAIDGGFTKHFSADFDSGVSVGGGGGYLIQTTATAANPEWTWTGASDVATAIATFKAASGGGGGSCGARLLTVGVGGGGC